MPKENNENNINVKIKSTKLHFLLKKYSMFLWEKQEIFLSW